MARINKQINYVNLMDPKFKIINLTLYEIYLNILFDFDFNFSKLIGSWVPESTNQNVEYYNRISRVPWTSLKSNLIVHQEHCCIPTDSLPLACFNSTLGQMKRGQHYAKLVWPVQYGHSFPTDFHFITSLEIGKWFECIKMIVVTRKFANCKFHQKVDPPVIQRIGFKR